MATRSEKVKLGIFLAVAGTLLIGGLAVLSGSELWQERSGYVIRFMESVSGLEPGAPVKQRGVRVGYVDRIRVDPENVEKVEVWVKVNPDTPVKKDTKAFMNIQGITGLKFIELKGGSAKSERLPPGSEIEAGTTTLQELSGRASDIGMKFEKLLNNLLTLTRPENRAKFDDIIREANQTVKELKSTAAESKNLVSSAEKFLDENRDPLEASLISVEKTSNAARSTLENVQTLVSQAEREIKQADLPKTVAGIRETNDMIRGRIEGMETKKAVKSVTVALNTLQRLLEQVSETIGQNQDAVRVMIHNLRNVSENLKEVSRTFQEKPYIQIFGNQPNERNVPK
jgi:phospholipid/cholesterol/gamma-HCH transport system substrate-binding protein